MEQLTIFDYQQLDTETRIVVQQRTGEIKALMKRTAQDIIEIGEKLAEVRDRLADNKAGGFEAWLKAEFNWGKTTAYRFINVAVNFNRSNLERLDFAPSALYLLAAPSTPDLIRQEMINRAQDGETITYSTVRNALGIHKTIDPTVTYSGNGAGITQAEREESAQDSRLDAALADEGKTVCQECGQVYDGPRCPDCIPYNYLRDNRRATPSDIYAPQGNDACQTPPYAIDPLLPYLPASWVIWEPAQGEGYLVEALYDASRQVTGSDILDGQNFFEYEPDTWDCIVTNPPFSITQQWLKRCYELGKPFALLIKVEALGTKGVQELIQEYGFEMILLDKRIDFKMPFLGWGDEERKSSAQFPVFWLCWQLLPEQVKATFGKIDKGRWNGSSD